jgi:hypothetical protein
MSERQFRKPAPHEAAPDPNAPKVPPNRELIDEALKKHAELRGPKPKPKIMPITPMLPRVPKPYKKKKPRPGPSAGPAKP